MTSERIVSDTFFFAFSQVICSGVSQTLTRSVLPAAIEILRLADFMLVVALIPS